MTINISTGSRLHIPIMENYFQDISSIRTNSTTKNTAIGLRLDLPTKDKYPRTTTPGNVAVVIVQLNDSDYVVPRYIKWL